MEPTKPRPQQQIDRKQSLEKEHKDALDRAVSLNVPHAVAATKEGSETIDTATKSRESATSSNSKRSSQKTNSDELAEGQEGEKSATDSQSGERNNNLDELVEGQEGGVSGSGYVSKSCRGTNWDELVEKLFTRTEEGGLILKEEVISTVS